MSDPSSDNNTVDAVQVAIIIIPSVVENEDVIPTNRDDNSSHISPTSIGQRFKETIGRASEKIHDTLHNVKEKVVGTLTHAKSDATETVEDAKQAVNETVESMKDKSESAYETSKDKSYQAMNSVKDTAQKVKETVAEKVEEVKEKVSEGIEKVKTAVTPQDLGTTADKNEVEILVRDRDEQQEEEMDVASTGSFKKQRTVPMDTSSTITLPEQQQQQQQQDIPPISNQEEEKQKAELPREWQMDVGPGVMEQRVPFTQVDQPAASDLSSSTIDFPLVSTETVVETETEVIITIDDVIVDREGADEEDEDEEDEDEDGDNVVMSAATSDAVMEVVDALAAAAAAGNMDEVVADLAKTVGEDVLDAVSNLIEAANEQILVEDVDEDEEEMKNQAQ